MAWKTPHRPAYEISQAFNDKPVTIYRLHDAARNGYMPVPVPEVIGTYPTQKRTVGVTRYYAARQNQIDIEAVIRIPNPGVEITNKDVARFEGEDRPYRIDQVQEVNDVYPPCLDLTLTDYDRRDEDALV